MRSVLIILLLAAAAPAFAEPIEVVRERAKREWTGHEESIRNYEAEIAKERAQITEWEKYGGEPKAVASIAMLKESIADRQKNLEQLKKVHAGEHPPAPFAVEKPPSKQELDALLEGAKVARLTFVGPPSAPDFKLGEQFKSADDFRVAAQQDLLFDQVYVTFSVNDETRKRLSLLMETATKLKLETDAAHVQVFDQAFDDKKREEALQLVPRVAEDFAAALKSADAQAQTKSDSVKPPELAVIHFTLADGYAGRVTIAQANVESVIRLINPSAKPTLLPKLGLIVTLVDESPNSTTENQRLVQEAIKQAIYPLEKRTK